MPPRMASTLRTSSSTASSRKRDDLRGLGAYFGAGSLAADDGTTVQIPDAWADGWKYFYDGMWGTTPS